jgi:hypothetical protein
MWACNASISSFPVTGTTLNSVWLEEESISINAGLDLSHQNHAYVRSSLKLPSQRAKEENWYSSSSLAREKDVAVQDLRQPAM